MDLPHSVTTAVTYRLRIDSLNELPKDKRPPRNLWDKPYRLNDFLDDIFNTKSNKPDTKAERFINIDTEEVE